MSQGLSRRCTKGLCRSSNGERFSKAATARCVLLLSAVAAILHLCRGSRLLQVGVRASLPLTFAASPSPPFSVALFRSASSVQAHRLGCARKLPSEHEPPCCTQREARLFLPLAFGCRPSLPRALRCATYIPTSWASGTCGTCTCGTLLTRPGAQEENERRTRKGEGGRGLTVVFCEKDPPCSLLSSAFPAQIHSLRQPRSMSVCLYYCRWWTAVPLDKTRENDAFKRSDVNCINPESWLVWRAREKEGKELAELK